MSTEAHVTDLTRPPTAMEIALQIPAPVQHIVLPAKSLSIVSLLRSSIIPGPCAMLNPELSHTAPWISSIIPSAIFKPEDLLQMALPPIRVVEAVEKVLLTLLSAAPQSIIAAHLSDQPGVPKHLPLWVVTYWKAAHRVRNVRQMWRTSLEWAQKGTVGSSYGRQALERLNKNLTHLAWDDSLKGDVRSSTSLSSISECIPAYLSNALLTGSHIDQLLARLRRRLETLPEIGWTASHSLVGPDMISSIVAASKDTPENVEHLRKYDTIRLLEFDLVGGHTASVGGVAYINDNHYTAVVLRVRDRYLGYGDSMNGRMPKDLRCAMLWWIARLMDKGLDGGGDVPIDHQLTTDTLAEC
ncbi:hypothetical protein BC835DRAFT_1308252 [Cytidiella melzeri]|nr:hypothetical protein BC835DRAFT_1308252 [Cytidiella melzeri]